MKKLVFVFMLLATTLSLFAQKGGYVVIGATDVRMRSTAGTSGDLVGKVQMGEIAKILEVSSKSEHIKGTANPGSGCDEFYWYKLDFKGKVGWVFGAFVFHLDNETLITGEETNPENLHIATAYQRETGGDMCYGKHFLVVLPEHYTSARKAKLLQNYKGKGESYRGMPALGFDMGIIQCFMKEGGKIVLTTGGEGYVGYAEINVIELTPNGEGGYNAVEKYSSRDN